MKNRRREREKIGIYLVTLSSQKSEKHAWLFISARTIVTPCIACEKARVNLQGTRTLYQQ